MPGAALGVWLLAGPSLAQPPGPGAADRCEQPSRAAEAAGASQAAPSPAALELERGTALLLAGDASSARAAYQESQRLALAGDDPQLAALAHANAARAALDAGQLEGLEAELGQVLAAALAFEAAGARARLLIHVGRTYLKLVQVQPSARASATPRAGEALAAAAEASAAAGDRRAESYALGYLGELYEREGHLDEALALTRRAVFAAVESEARESLYRWQWQLGRIQRSAGREPQAVSAYRQAVATLAEIRPDVGLGSSSSEVAFRSEIEPVYFGLVDLLLSRAARAANGADEQALLAEARNSLEDLKAAELRDYFGDPCLDAQRKAAPDEIPGAVVVYPIALADRLELVVARTGRLERFTAAVDRETLMSEVRSFRHRLERRTTRQHLAHGQRLYDWLIRPMQAALRDPAPEALVFVPGGALRTIPFGALSDRETGRFLIEQHPVAIVPSLTLTNPRAIDRSRVQVLAAGITESVLGYSPLANVRKEIDALEQVFPGRQLMNAEFAVARFEQEVNERPFGIIHIASHAEFTADPAQSFLLAHDGKISIDRLSALVETTRFRDQQALELLTLSACETATDDERAALGLAGVALRAGARSALATLWAVSDESSSELVTEFYAQLADPGVSRARALQRAQLALLKTHHFNHPAFWAPFLLISSWL